MTDDAPESAADSTEPPGDADSPASSDADARDDAEVTPTRRQKIVAFAFASGGFLIFYVLSAGPMVAILQAAKFSPFQRALEIVYAPLVLIVKSRVEPFSGWLKAYIELFR